MSRKHFFQWDFWRQKCHKICLAERCHKPAFQNNVQVLRFTRVPFEIISSPFLLATTVKYHLNKEDTPVIQNISHNIYVNNMITGVNTAEQGGEFYKDARSLFQSSAMNLREWASNSKEFLQRIPESDGTSGDTIKVLGTTWNMNSDTLFINGSDTSSCQVTSHTKWKTVHSKTLETRARLGWDSECIKTARVVEAARRPYSIVLMGNTYIHRTRRIQLFCFTDASVKVHSPAVYL